MKDGLRELLHAELDVILNRDKGPNDFQPIELTVCQGSSTSRVRHSATIDPKYLPIIHHAVERRTVEKTVAHQEALP